MTLRNTMMAFGVFCLASASPARADLTYDFLADAQGFQNVTWQSADPAGWSGLPGAIKQAHTAGGWQMLQTKEFSWGPGGGDANQQTAMQALANLGNAHLKFDVLVNGTSFPPAAGVWFQFNLVGHSDGAAGWTQIEKLVDSWQNPGQADLRTWHLDLTFTQLGWNPGDTWFQFYTGCNSDAAYPVNFFLDNIVAYAPVPEPSALALLGLGAAALLMRRRK